MKFLIALFFLVSLSVQAITETKSGQYKLRHNGEILKDTYDSQSKARSAAEKISSDCHVRTNGGLCPVAVQQPELLITTKPDSSTSSSSASPPSKSSASSSSISSRVTLSWQAATQYEDGQTLPLEKICGYALKLGATPEFQVKSTGEKMNWIADEPKPGEIYQIATIETDGNCKNYSAYVNFK